METDDKERVRAAVNFEQLVAETVPLRPRGADLWGCCPFHHEKSPSFHINPSTGLWKCFGCGLGGDVFAYIMQREHLEFPDALKFLADKYGVELTQTSHRSSHTPKRVRLYACMQAAQEFYERTLLCSRSTKAQEARMYLQGRSFGSAVSKRWHLGFARGSNELLAELTKQGFTRQELLACDLARLTPQGLRERFFDRVMFPIHDEQGKCIAFGGRVIGDGKPKYLNTKDTVLFSKGKHLFAFDEAKNSLVVSGTAIVCEGYTDVISMHRAGFTNCVAALGTALTLDHIKLIERFATRKIICMFDGDAAGQKAAERAVQFLDQTRLEMLCVVLPQNLDPAEFLSAHSKEELAEILSHARPLLDFVLAKRLEHFDTRIEGQRVQALQSTSQLLAPLKHSLFLDDYASQVADLLDMDVNHVKASIKAAHKEATRAYTPTNNAPVGLQTSIQNNTLSSNSSRHALTSQHLLSADARMQKSSELELLSLMAAKPQLMHQYQDRIAHFNWLDASHEQLAWAMLATPVGATPAQVVGAATRAVPSAPNLLASGRVVSFSNLAPEMQFQFLVASVDLWSSIREVKKIKTQLKLARSSLTFEESQKLLEKATQLQKHISELKSIISNVI